MKNGMYRSFFKRVLDLLLSLTGFILLLPLFIIAAIALSVANKGSAFFFQERIGRGEKPFRIIKFKSMTDARDKDGNLLLDKDRLTRAGIIIRRTSIDELPQLLNVIKGDMALIGPRPLLPRYLPYYTERERTRHSVRPGITGLAQTSGRNAISWEQKLEFDAEYVETLSFKNDVRIFLQTVKKVLKSEGVQAANKETYLDEERRNLK